MKHIPQILSANYCLSLLNIAPAKHPSMLRSSPAKALPLHLILSDLSSPHSFSSHPRPRNHTGLILQATSMVLLHFPFFNNFLSVTHFLYLLIIHCFSACVMFSFFLGSLFVNYSSSSNLSLSTLFIPRFWPSITWHNA